MAWFPNISSKFALQIASNYALTDSVDELVPFPRTNYLIVLVTAAQPSATAYPVTLESLVH